MTAKHLTIGFARRGFSPSGGAEAYLKRLARGVVERGHAAQLVTTGNWPPNEWPFGPITRLNGASPVSFANEFARLQPRGDSDVMLSMERVWQCDVYRAGDGVHRAWLERRSAHEPAFQKIVRSYNAKNRAAVRLEKSLFAKRGAGRVIANSRMVKDEIVRFYGYPSDKISVIYNGVPLAELRNAQGERDRSRLTLGLRDEDIAVLFVGSGWERKGLSYAIEAVEGCGGNMRLLVAGRGREPNFRSRVTQFLGVVPDPTSLYGAADIFLLPTIYDPFSNACLEALAAGLPVITTMSNGFSEIIEDGLHGSIIRDPRNQPTLRDALRFWSNASRRQEARQRNITLAAQFDMSRNVAETLDVLIQGAASAAST